MHFWGKMDKRKKRYFICGGKGIFLRNMESVENKNQIFGGKWSHPDFCYRNTLIVIIL